MSDLSAKMHQNRFPLGLRLRPRWASLQRSPGPLPGFKGPTSKGRERGRKRREGKGRRGASALRWYGAPEWLIPTWSGGQNISLGRAVAPRLLCSYVPDLL